MRLTQRAEAGDNGERELRRPRESEREGLATGGKAEMAAMSLKPSELKFSVWEMNGTTLEDGSQYTLYVYS